MKYIIKKIIQRNKGKSINSLILDLELQGIETWFDNENNKIFCLYHNREYVINIINK